MKGRIIDSIIRSVSSRRVHCLSTAAALSSSSSSSSSSSTITKSSSCAARRRNISLIINTTTRRSTSTHTSTSSTGSSTTTSTGNGQVHEIKSRILSNIHPLQLFRIIQDVDSYTKFLPLCYKSNVHKNSICHGGRQFNAELVVGFGGSSSSSNFLFGSSPLFKTRYISQVIVNPNELTIETTSDGSINNNDEDDVDDHNDNDDDHHHQRFFDSLSSSWKLRPYYNNDINNDNNNDIENNDDRAATNDIVNNNIGGTIVDFKVEMIGISNPIIRSILNSSVLYNVAEIQVTAFEKRCLQLHKDQDHLQSLSNQEILLASKFYKL